MCTSGCRWNACALDRGTGTERTVRTRAFASIIWRVAGLLLATVALLFAASAPAWAQDPAVEVCDGIDNDGDGDTDEGFDVGEDCSVSSNSAYGPCVTAGSRECSEDGTDTECVADPEADCVAASAAVFVHTLSVGTSDDPPPEVCDGVDNDGDGDVDEDFDVGAPCTFVPPPNAFGTCETAGTKLCKADTTGTECLPKQCQEGTSGVDCVPEDVEVDEAEPELLAAGDLSCFDGVDNDCDGTADVGGVMLDNDDDGTIDEVLDPDTDCASDTELFCNGLDEDNDGSVDEDFGVGDSCTAGIGQCERTGSIVCDTSDPALQATKCSVGPGTPFPEDTPGGFRCTDGLDNDCDGLIDLADPSCQTAELCDGLDNDGDSAIDEDFTDLGAACSVGVGACEVSGVLACNALGDGTQCNVVPALSGTEGPAGPSCADGIDNDCDGLTDGDDADCGSANLAVSCSLVSLKKNPPGGNTPRVGTRRPRPTPPGTSCEEKFRLVIESNVDPQFLTAEIMGLNPDGSLIDFSPNTLPVQNGDELHLNSRLDPADWKVDAKGRFIDVFAPVPLVRVTADTGQNRAEAFCSHIPWLDVDRPSGADQVVSATESNVLDVVVPIPRVDPATIGIIVDGVDILDDTHLNVDPSTAFPNPGAPIGGVIDINGQMVTVAGLVVDVAPSLDVGAMNSLTMTLENLGGGGHIVVVNGDPQANALPQQTSAQCHLDDVLDAGVVSVFGITIFEPAANSEVPAGDTTVRATISHGRDIHSAQVQGVAASLGAQTCSPLSFDAFGETFSVDTCSRDIDQTLPQTNLSMPLQLGTIDIGQNDLTIGAEDDLMNQVFARQRFTSGIGSTVAPATLALSPRARADLERKLEVGLRGAFDRSPELPQPIDIEVSANAMSFNLAFTFGIKETGINKFFQSVCTQAKLAVDEAIDEALSNATFDPVTVPVDGACDPTVTITPPELALVGDLICNVDTQQDFLTVTVTLPTIDFSIGASVYCKHTKKILGIRVCISKITGSLDLDLSLSDFGFEFDIDEQLVLEGGSTDATDFIEGGIFSSVANSTVDVGCLAGFFLDVVKVFTFGALDLEEEIEDAVEDALTFDLDIEEALRASNPDPLEVQKIELNEELVEADGIEVAQDVLQIMITEEGLVGTIGAAFTVPLPEEDDFAATVMESPAPEFPIPNSKELFFAASDDIFNLLFAAIGLQGALTTTCVDSGVTFSETLPVDCNALMGADQTQTDIMIGRCHGAKAIDCNTLANPGQAFFCQITKDQLAAANIGTDTGLLFCAAQPLAPRTLIRDFVPTPETVEAELHANDLVITIALDRNGDNQFDPDQFFPLAQTCLGFLEDVTKDCKLSDACFDLNLDAEFQLGMPTPGSAQIVRTVTGINDFVGMECGGLLNLGSGPVVISEAGTSSPVSTIANNIQEIVRIFEALGLDLGSLVGLSAPRVLAIDVPTFADPDCADCAEYVGITGDIIIP